MVTRIKLNNLRELDKVYNRGKHKLRYLLGLEKRKNYFDCIGVTSHCIRERENFNEVLGHVTMFDVENNSYTEVRNYFKERYDVLFIFESSKDNYHVLIPWIRDFEETYRDMLKCEKEHDPHAKIGYKRGDWVLRISDKPNKPKPILRYANAIQNKNKSYSWGHLEYIRQLYDSEIAENCLKYMNTEGDRLKSVKYSTFK